MRRWWIAAVVLLVACAPSVSTPGGTPTPFVVAQPTDRSTVAPTAEAATAAPVTPTPPSPTPILPTPALPDSDDSAFYLGDLVLAQADSACQLPCWQGLRIGQSQPEQARQVFDDTFSFNGMLDLSLDTRDTEFMDVDGLDEYYPIGHLWMIDNVIGIATVFRVEDNMLAGIVFKWITSDNDRPIVRMTPQQIIEELGTPDHFLVRINGTERADIGNAIMMLIYKQGAVFSFEHFVPIEVVEDPDNPGYFKSRTVELCLGNQDNMGVVGKMYLGESFNSDLTDLSSLQRRFTTQIIDFRRLRPLSEVFGISADDVTALAHVQDNVCLHTEAD